MLLVPVGAHSSTPVRNFNRDVSLNTTGKIISSQAILPLSRNNHGVNSLAGVEVEAVVAVIPVHFFSMIERSGKL